MDDLDCGHWGGVRSCNVKLSRLIILGSGRSLQVALVFEVLDNDLDSILHTRFVALDMNLGLQGLLVRRTDTRKLGDLALPCLLVETLRVTLLGDFNRHINPDLHKGNARLASRALGLVQRASLVAIGSVGGNERSDGDGAGISEELGHFGDAADVLLTVLWAETEVLVESETDVVAVKTISGKIVRMAQEGLLKRHSDGGFPGGGQACEPDGEAALLAKAGADGHGQRGWVECNVPVLAVSIAVLFCCILFTNGARASSWSEVGM